LLSAETPVGFLIPLLSSLYLRFSKYQAEDAARFSLALRFRSRNNCRMCKRCIQGDCFLSKHT
jgi:hypothetical protein